MLIALIQDGVVTQVADYRSLFPNTSFPASGVSDEFLAENSAMKVNLFLPYDSATQRLVPTEPYIDSGWVYTVKVENKTPEELQAEEEAFNAFQKASRNQAYQQEADPLFFKWQRGEGTEAEWLAKVAEIKERFPYKTTENT